MKTLPVAVQVYSVREDAEKDFAGTMKKIKEIGYDGVELAGLYGLEPAAIKAAIEDAGLVALSAHVPFQELVADMEGTIQKYVEIGMKYIAIPYLMEEDRPGTPKFEGNVKLFEEIAKACKAKGIQLLYHNHDFEFQKMADGRYALDYIYDTIPADLLQTEVDTCWVKVAGEDPAAYVKKYTGRSPLVHLKDFHKEGRPANMYQLIGTEVEEQESHGRNCKCLKFSLWGITVYDQFRYRNDWNSDSFRNVDDSEGEKKRSENWLENSYFEGKRAQNT